MKVLAIDYGKKRVGIASGDTNFKIAFPRAVLQNRGNDSLIEDIKKICDEMGVSMIVVGLPLNMEEEYPSNEILDDVEIFVDELKDTLKDVKVVLFDERLSTFEGKALMKDIKNIGGKQTLDDDAYAAQIILQRFFEKETS